MPTRICIVGAGVIGLSVATRLYEVFGLDEIEVTIIAEDFTPNTTSDQAGAIIVPFNVSDVSVHDPNILQAQKWTKATFEYFHELNKSEEAGLIDIQLVNGYYSEASDSLASPAPWWSGLTPGFRRVDDEEKQLVNIPSHFRKIYNFSTYIINGKKYLPWLMKKIREKGGIFIQRKITDLIEVCSKYDITINCTGLGAYSLINDKSLYPIHGDAVLIKAPWIKQFYFLIDQSDFTFIFPRSKDVVLGGSKRLNDWSKLPDEALVNAMFKRCASLVPSIARCRPLLTWGCLRPCRDVIRLEMDKDSKFPLIHCYGHAGQGVIMGRGCALDVCDLVVEHLKQNMKAKL